MHDPGSGQNDGDARPSGSPPAAPGAAELFPGFGAASPGYAAPPTGYVAPGHSAPAPGHAVPPPGYSSAPPAFGTPPAFGAPPTVGAPPAFGAPPSAYAVAPPTAGANSSAFATAPPTDPDRPRTHRSRVPLILSIAGVLVAGVAFGGVQAGANLTYDASAVEFASSSVAASAASVELEAEHVAVSASMESATQISQSDTAGLIPVENVDALNAATTSAGTIIDEAALALDAEVPMADAKPEWFWELFDDANTLSQQSTDLTEWEQELDAHSIELADAGGELEDAAILALTAASDAAPGFEAAHISAKTLDVIALRDAASAVKAVTELDDEAVAAFATLQTAAQQVVASEQTELAEKAGPLQATRLEIEAFARSLAPGVLLEFDWTRIVNGAGEGGSMGGYTTWWWGDQGRAVIELSQSVAELWPDESARALVAHEVGHAISVKCEGMYDASTPDSIEKWATAWAISMGFTDDGNGVWAYGYPPQSYIDAAYGCR